MITTGCAPRVDRKDFEPLYRSGKATSSATEIGVSYNTFSGLVQGLASEVSIANDRADNKAEKEMTKAYQEALAAYHASLVVWKNSIDGSRYDFIPEGEIYVEDELKPIVAKYSLSTQSRNIEITGHQFETIPESSVQVIWASAGKFLKTANRIYAER
jgi:hypothetical protein